MNKKIFIFLFLFILLFFGFNFFSALAAEPLLLFSWKAENFVPNWYQGKSLPINQTKIILSFEAISQNDKDYGKIIDLSGREIKWYLNNNLVKKGNGLKSIIVTKDDFFKEFLDVKIKIDFYDASTDNNYFISKYFTIPVTSPEVVLSHKKTEDFISLDETVNFKLFPFFFNVANDMLNVKWKVNEYTPDFNDDEKFSLSLKLKDTPPSKQVKISAIIANPNNLMEIGSKNLILKAR